MGSCFNATNFFQKFLIVSIQLVSPTSGEEELIKNFSYPWGYRVSIQLVSPTSGEQMQKPEKKELVSFHSISFPNEWGDNVAGKSYVDQDCFHSISFPNEWGVFCFLVFFSLLYPQVSIQLVSPTSGEHGTRSNQAERNIVSIQLVSPTSGEKGFIV